VVQKKFREKDLPFDLSRFAVIGNSKAPREFSAFYFEEDSPDHRDSPRYPQLPGERVFLSVIL